MEEISIQEAMSLIRSDEMEGDTFILRFVRSGGKAKGSICTIAKARYGSPRGYDRSTKRITNQNGEKRQSSKHVTAGTLPLTDTEKNQYFTPLISHVIGFNQYKVRH